MPSGPFAFDILMKEDNLIISWTEVGFTKNDSGFLQDTKSWKECEGLDIEFDNVLPTFTK